MRKGRREEDTDRWAEGDLRSNYANRPIRRDRWREATESMYRETAYL